VEMSFDQAKEKRRQLIDTAASGATRYWPAVC